MALKLLVSLAILKLALSVPYPDPDNNIHINVQQIVNVGGCCPETRPCDPKDCTYMGKTGVCGREAQPPFIEEVGAQECCDECKCYIEGCVFGDKVYPDGATIQDTCMVLQCIEGVWNYTGKVDKKCCTVDGTAYRNGSRTEDRCISLQCLNGAWEYYNKDSEYDAWNECNHCYSTGNTNINMRDHHLIDGSKIINYRVNEIGTYAFSQSGLEIPAQVIMEATFEYINEYHNETHITSVTYKELGIKVELVFPSPNDYEYCNDNPTDPHCEAKILVNGFKITLDKTFSSVASFYGLGGTVYIINRGQHWPWTNHWGRFYIVGSQGTSVRVDYGGWYAVYAVSMASPSLQNKVFGLCDVFTGGIPTGFTASNGSVTTDINEFIQSWKLAKQEME